MHIDFLSGKYSHEQSGVFHWLMQRISAVALIPLPWWTVIYLKHLLHSPYEQFAAWLTAPWNILFLAVSALAAVYHAILGIQSILDDYVHRERGKEIAMLLVTSTFIILSIAILAGVWLIK